MNILLVAAECAPLAKVGGLGDVVGALQIALSELKHDARVILPFYQSIKPDFVPAEPALWFDVEFGGKNHLVEIFETNLPYSEARVYLVSQPDMFAGGVYENKNAEPGGAGETEKFMFFSAAVLQFLQHSAWRPVVVHCHDWHAAL